MGTIQNGNGGDVAAVDKSKRLHTHTISITEAVEAVENGDAYNINTGNIGLTSQSESAIFYLKNNEIRDLEIDSLAIGIDNNGTRVNDALITIVRNPTSVSFATPVDMNENRNFGSSNTLDINTFKGAEAATIAGGSDLAQFYADGPRLFIENINFTLTKGSSLAIKIDTDTTAGTTNVYAAAICHLKRN